MLSEDMAEVVEREYPTLDKIYENQMVIRVSGRRVEFDSVKFVRCRMEKCDFSGISFYSMISDRCDFSSCSFQDTYWRNVNISDSKGDGSQLCNSTFKQVKLLDSRFHYGNFSTVFREFGEIRGYNFQESSMSEMKFKRTVLSSTDLTGTDFLRTPLKGIDLPECTIDGITVSDQLTELSEVKVGLLQAAELTRLMSVKIVQEDYIIQTIYRKQEGVTMIESMAIQELLDVLSSKEPVPGGEGASTLAGVLGNALRQVVSNLTIGKKKCALVKDEIEELAERVKGIQEQSTQLADQDAKMSVPLAKCYSLPSGTEKEKACKVEVMEARLLDVSPIPIEVMEKAVEMLEIMDILADKGSRMTVSDVGVGAQFIRTASLGAVMSVYVNTKSVKNEGKTEGMNEEAERLIREGTETADHIYQKVLG